MDRHFPQRKSPRLQGYDYSQAGAYFVTICTHKREHLFGAVVGDAMVLSAAGQIAEQRWLALPDHHPGVELDAFVVMPNHVHGIIILVGTASLREVPASSGAHHNNGLSLTPDAAGRVPTLGTVIGSYKSGVTRRIRQAEDNPHRRVWQGRYHDHIIRDEQDADRLRHYVAYNPARWAEDVFYA